MIIACLKYYNKHIAIILQLLIMEGFFSLNLPNEHCNPKNIIEKNAT